MNKKERDHFYRLLTNEDELKFWKKKYNLKTFDSTALLSDGTLSLKANEEIPVPFCYTCLLNSTEVIKF